MRAVLPSQEVLRALLHYDPRTGILTWKERETALFANAKFGSSAAQRAWNRRNAGRRAFYGIDSKGYHYGTIFHVQRFAHRVIWKWVTGVDPDYIDHINGNRSDNRWANLRSTDASGNARNSARSTKNLSGYVGVSFSKAHNCWQAYICRTKLGNYPTKEAAIRVRLEAERRHGFHPNHGRDAA